MAHASKMFCPSLVVYTNYSLDKPGYAQGGTYQMGFVESLQCYIPLLDTRLGGGT